VHVGAQKGERAGSYRKVPVSGSRAAWDLIAVLPRKGAADPTAPLHVRKRPSWHGSSHAFHSFIHSFCGHIASYAAWRASDTRMLSPTPFVYASSALLQSFASVALQ
jgi:hypothetical protein